MTDHTHEIKIITDIVLAEQVWRSLSPNDTIYDTWEFRYCFYKPFNYPLSFRAVYVEDEPVALLPLQLNTDANYLEFFGGTHMENNQIFLKPDCEKYIAELYATIQGPVKMEWTLGNDPYTKSLPVQDYDYFLTLDQFQTFEQFLKESPNSELKRKWKKITTDNEIQILVNQFEDIELLFQWNIEKFKEESTFLMPFRQDIYREAVRLELLKPLLFTFVVNGKKQAVSLAYTYNNTYMSMNYGIHPECEVRNLSAFIILHQIKSAIEQKNRYIDVLTCDCGWKESWGFSKIAQYEFISN